ncbi:MAG: gapA [Chlamydiia bacterium]|nr:gapA [Chlamydiia bacterium]
MSVRVAINGFGRIGRLALRCMLDLSDVEVVAINDLASSETLAYFFTYDSVHGKFQGDVQSQSDALIINQKRIAIYNRKDPSELPWKELQVDYVIEASGRFLTRELAGKHLTAGAQRVLITAPATDDIPTFVLGVNEHTFDPRKDDIVSNASCTTNCLAPICKVLLDTFGIEEGLMTTVHATTASQSIVDTTSKGTLRAGRSALQSIIPFSTGAASSVAQCIPELKNKLSGMAFRVPVAAVSVVDLTVRLSQPATYQAVCQAMEKAAASSMKGILSVTDEQVVSCDFIGSSYSAIFDKGAGIALNSNFFKLIAWYDNEMGYSQRVVDLVRFIARVDKKIDF